MDPAWIFSKKYNNLVAFTSVSMACFTVAGVYSFVSQGYSSFSYVLFSASLLFLFSLLFLIKKKIDHGEKNLKNLFKSL